MTRRVTSLTLFFSFILLTVSSIFLYIMPEGRVAYWGNWTGLGLSKPQWGNLHITGGVLFLLAGLWHTLLNWKAVVASMRTSTRNHAAAPYALIAALALNVFVVAGTLLDLPPMKQLIQLNLSIKSYQADKHGNPPYPHAELSPLDKFCGFLGLDVPQVVSALNQQLTGDIGPQTTILEIADKNNITPQQLYELIRKGVSGGDPFELMPPSPPEGTGKMPLSKLCNDYALPMEDVMKKLTKAGLEPSPEKTLREIGAPRAMHPHDVYSLIRTGGK